jgi:hypothetical protein
VTDAGYPATDTLVGLVRLDVPAVAQMSRVARLAASGLASLAGCTLEEIDDIKIAVSEALIALIEIGGGDRVALELGMTPDGFAVHAEAFVGDLDVEHEDLMLCRTVLAEVSVHHNIRVDGGVAVIDAVVAHAPGV